jgi:hypothetical protein
MRRSRFTEEQRVAILREGDRRSVAGAAKKNVASEQTADHRCGRLDPFQARHRRAGPLVSTAPRSSCARTAARSSSPSIGVSSTARTK